MRKKGLVILVLIVMGYASQVSAGTYSGRFKPYFWSNGLYIEPIGVTATNVPSCATRTLLRLQETDMSTPIFRYKYAMLLTEWVAGSQMTLYGTGDCTTEGDERIMAIRP